MKRNSHQLRINLYLLFSLFLFVFLLFPVRASVTFQSGSQSPVNNTQRDDNHPYLNASIQPYSDTSTTISCTLYVDGRANQTVNNIQNNTVVYLNSSELSSGDHSWHINCTDDNWATQTQSEVRTIGIGSQFSRCAVLIDDYGIYNLTGDVLYSGTCITMENNHTILDCGGHTIDVNFSGGDGILVNSIDNITIKNCNIRNSRICLNFHNYWTYNSVVDNVNCSSLPTTDHVGIRMNNMQNSTIKNCNLANLHDGIWFDLYHTFNNSVINNTLSNITKYGLGMRGQWEPYTASSLIYNNTFKNVSDTAIYFDDVNSTTVQKNTITNSTTGIWFYEYSGKNVIKENKINAKYGIKISSYSDHNKIYNNLINSTNPVVGNLFNYWNTTKQAGDNIWNASLGYIGGNLWTNPNNNGFSDTCNDIGSDGFCDSPYELGTNNIDYLPIAKVQGQDTTPPTFSNWQQNPPDLNSSSMGKLYINVTITDDSGVNDSSVKFYHWINDSQYPNQPWKFINGTAQEFEHEHTMTNITPSIFNITLHTYAYNPSVFNVDPETMRSATKYNYSLDSNKETFKIRFYNISTHPNTTYILKPRLYRNSGDLLVYFCNSSYTSGKVYNSNYCIPLATLTTQESTKYQNIYFYGDENSRLNAVKMTPTGYIVFYATVGSDWEVEYANIDSNSAETSSNGGTTWSSQDFSADTWLVQLNGNGLTTVGYKVYACDMLGNCANSSVQEDFYAIANLPPSPAPKITVPENTTYSGTFNITWEYSKDPNGDPFNYSVYLYYSNDTLADVLADNNITEGTEYLEFNSVNYPDGQYYLIANATDDAGNTNFYIMPYYFTLDNTPPTYSDNSTNSTLAGTPVEHRLKWSDNTGLSGYIFSFDNCTGSFVNDTWVAFSSNPDWSNVTKVINSTVGCKIRWKVYANDTSNNWNVSDTYSYITTSYISVTFSYNTVNFGVLNPNTTDNPAPDQTEGIYNVSVDTNANYKLEANGTDFSSGTSSFSISNLKMDTNSTAGNLALSDSVSLTSIPQVIDTNIPPTETINYHGFWLSIPAKQYAGTYSSTVTITYSTV